MRQQLHENLVTFGYNWKKIAYKAIKIECLRSIIKWLFIEETYRRDYDGI